MKVDFLSQAGKLLKEQKQYRRRLIVFLCLAVVVVYGTLTALKLYGQAMTHKMEVLDCQYEVHEHTDECYEMDEEGNLGTEPVCGYADYVIHVHNDDCYDADGNLTCGLEEHPAHEHTEECYVTEMVLVCGEEAQEDTEAGTESSADASEGSADVESSAAAEGSAEAPDSEESVPEASEPQEPEIICGMEEHVHDDSCLGQVLVCTQEGHEHTVECVDRDGNVICGKEEHVHDGNCQDAEGNIICGQEEHRHIIVCYDEDGNEICGKAVHTHDDSCRDAEGNIICGLEEHEHIVRCYQEGYICGTEEHTHTEACYAQEEAEGESTEAGAAEPEESTASAEQESSAESKESSEAGTESSVETAGHVHTDECYEEVKTLICGEQELHTHDDSCYDEECFDEDGNLIEGSRPSCGLLQLEEHVHTKECFKTIELTPEEVAALENGAKLHIHTEECYDEEGNLICGHDATHIHQPECYDDAGKLICGYGAAVHVHEDKCYDEEGKLICGYETAAHLHEESCYDADGNLQCGYETASHVHGKECYDEEGKLTCGYEAAAHVHEDSCYDAEGNLICGYGTLFDTEDTVKLEGTFTYEAEDYTLEIHVETDIPSESAESDASVESTTDEESAGTDAATEEKAESSSEAQVSGTEDSSSTEPTEAESQPVTDDSAEESGQEADASGIEELSEVQEGDTDTTVPETEESQDGSGDAPEETDAEEAEGQPEQDAQILLADENSGLTLKMIPLAAETDIHTEMASYVDGIDGSKLLDLSVMELHVYRDGKEIDISDCAVAVNIIPKAVTTEEMIEAYGEEAAAEEGNGIIVSALQETAEGVQGSGNVFLTPDMEEIPVLQNAVAENGVLAIARYVNNETFTKTFQGESFIVTATYRSYANIPAEAELIAELITEESDSEHYAKRQAEYQEALGDETATMQALMKIGFYVEDENGEFTQEVEPGSPVTITIQFLDEDGLAEGKPITVIHFAEEGTEMLEGSKVQDGSTTFRMESFSEIAVGYGVKNVKVSLDEVIDYDTDTFHIAFHIEGEVSVPVDNKTGSEGNDQEVSENGNSTEAIEEGEEGSNSSKQVGSQEDTEDELLTSEETFSALIEKEELEGALEFKLDSLDENSEEYSAVAGYAEELGDENEELLLQILSYSLNYGSAELDLSNCKVTAEISPTEALVDSAMEIIDAKEAEALSALENDFVPQMPDDSEIENALSDAGMVENDIFDEAGDESEAEDSIDDFTEDEDSGVPEDQSGLIIAAIEILDGTEIGEIETMSVREAAGGITEESNSGTPELIVMELTANTFALRAATAQPNPKFTVWYYAKLQVLDTSEATVNLAVIDTSNGGENKQGKLPKNGKTVTKTNIPLNADGTIKTKESLEEVYKSRSYSYYKAPTINYFNALIENSSYTLTEVWVNRKKEDGSYVDWSDVKGIEKYGYSSQLHFTNREEAATANPNGNSGYVYISPDARIRLVYTVTTDPKHPFPTAFYDYDISSSKGTSGDVITMNTASGGINAATGINNEVTRYAFGNVNCGTNYGAQQWDGNDLNKYNEKNRNTGASGCTFGLVNGINEDRTNVIFASGINAPQNLFGPDAYEGKSVYGGDLKFIRNGDTYTLTEAVVTSEENNVVKTVGTISNLHMFNQPSPYTGKTYDHIWTNNFWPLDNADSSKRKDINFGVVTGLNDKNNAVGNGKQKFSGSKSGNLPVSDDGADHNSFFGMSYQVGFELTEDYVGPLEYYFFGDDDMWVFLDGTLVCDIGGVHSSVGEYVNLWDYLAKGSSGKHTLTFFYTERGASGSTCWMQFTLPSVTSIEPPKKDYGELKVEKTVANIDKDKEFNFHIMLTDANGNKLADNYSYAKYQKSTDGSEDQLVAGTEEDQFGLVLFDGSDFTLKDGQYIVIRYLPAGTRYTVTEEDGTYYTDIVRDDNGAIVKKDGLLSEKDIAGSISDGIQSTVLYKNYNYNLPKTGGSGTILYTIAGGIALIFGAGFLYRKKFRERRG